MSLRKQFPELEAAIIDIAKDISNTYQKLKADQQLIFAREARLHVLIKHQSDIDRIFASTMQLIMQKPTKYKANIKAIDQANAAYEAFTAFYNTEGEAGILAKLPLDELATLLTDLQARVNGKLKACEALNGMSPARVAHIAPIFERCIETIRPFHASIIELENTVYALRHALVESGDISEKQINEMLGYRQANIEHAPKSRATPVKLKHPKIKEPRDKSSRELIDAADITKDVYQALKSAPPLNPVAAAAPVRLFRPKPKPKKEPEIIDIPLSTYYAEKKGKKRW